jgi:hypothetical protein
MGHLPARCGLTSGLPKNPKNPENNRNATVAPVPETATKNRTRLAQTEVGRIDVMIIDAVMTDADGTLYKSFSSLRDAVRGQEISTCGR